jgi:hypothetical protein
MPLAAHCDSTNYNRNFIASAQYPDETLRGALLGTGATHMVWALYSNLIHGAGMATSFDEVPLFLNSIATQAQWEAEPTGKNFTITTAYPRATTSSYTVNGILMPATVGSQAQLDQTQPYSTLA